MRRRRTKFRRFVEGLLLLAGLVGIGIWAWSNVRSSVFQDWQSWVFDHQRRGEEATLTGYLADRSEKIGGRVRDWLKIPPPKTPDTAATRNPAAPAVPNTPPGTPVTPTE